MTEEIIIQCTVTSFLSDSLGWTKHGWNITRYNFEKYVHGSEPFWVDHYEFTPVAKFTIKKKSKP